jgi:N-ethylmaleimide reductase
MTPHKFFEPLKKMGDFELKNRIVLSPMTRGRAGAERVPNDLMAEY